MNLMDKMYFGMRLRLELAKARAKEFWASQDGVSNVVATIIILLIVVVLIGVFWKQLSGWLGGLMDRIFQDPGINSEDVTAAT